MNEDEFDIAAKFDYLAKECCRRVSERWSRGFGVQVPAVAFERIIDTVDAAISSQIAGIPGHIKGVASKLAKPDADFIEQQLTEAARFSAAASIHRIIATSVGCESANPDVHVDGNPGSRVH